MFCLFNLTAPSEIQPDGHTLSLPVGLPISRRRLGERDLLAIQLDDRALFLQRWLQLLRDEAARAKSPALTGLADAAAQWGGRASTDSASYRIVQIGRAHV